MTGRFQSCARCGGSLYTLLKNVWDVRYGIESTHDIVQCKSCSLIQLSNPFSPDRLVAFYERHYNFGGKVDGLYVRVRKWFLASPLYNIWLYFDGDPSFHSRKGSGRLLDVGCNEGRGLSIYRKNGFEVEGLELNVKAAEEAEKKGFKVRRGNLENHVLDRAYEVVVLSNVLEHSLKPKEMLANVLSVLKPGGQVWISCPNVESWQRRVFGRYWINWHVPFHISHFSAITLSNVLKAAGFEIRVEKQISPALWFVQSIIARLFAKTGHLTSQLQNPILVAFLLIWVRLFLFPVLWLGNRLGHGDCLIVIAERGKR